MDTSVGNSVIQWLLFITLTSPLILAVNNELFSPPNVGCACPNEHLIFNCTAVGSLGSTIWRVTAFDCLQNEIILRHSEYNSGGTTGLCNGGAIKGTSIGVEGNCYISQLNVTVAPELHTKTVTCLLTSSGVISPIRNVSVIVASELYREGPTGISLTDVNTNELTFSWNPVDPNCLPSNHNIMFDCGTCTTMGTTATCTDLQIPNICDFSVQNIACGQVGLASDPITVTLRVPNKPSVTIIPVYSADTQELIKFNASVEQQAPFNIVDGVSGSVTHYNLSYSGITTLNPTCPDSICEYTIEVAPSLCSQSVNTDVTLSASNRLGLGPPSNPTTLGCINQFVRVEYDPETSAILCQFLNQTNASRLCAVNYGQCNRVLIYSSQGSSTFNRISLNISSEVLECYVVTASSDETTVVVEGQTSTNTGPGSKNGSTLIAVIVPIVIVLLIITVAVIVLVIIIIMKIRTFHNKGNEAKVDTADSHVPTDKDWQSVPEPDTKTWWSKLKSKFS